MQVGVQSKVKNIFRQIMKIEGSSVHVRSLPTIINFHVFIIVALVIVDLILVWFKPFSWKQGAVGATLSILIFIANLLYLRIRPSYIQGVMGLLAGAYINVWAVIFGIGYSASPIFWLTLVSFIAIPIAGYKLGTLFATINLILFSFYHYATWTLQYSFISVGPTIADSPSGYFVSTSLFLIFGGLLGAMLDYSHQRSQKKLLLSEHKRNLYLLQTSMAVIEAAEDGVIIEWNQAAESIFGYKLSDIQGKNVFDILVDRDDHTSVQAMLKQLRLSQDPELKYTIQNRTKNGEVVTCEWFNTPIRNEQGQIISFILSAVDVTERVAYRQELEAAREAAEEATKAKSAFLANMSHEIRTPMNGVIGMTSLLAHTALTEEQSEQVEIIRKSGTALLDVINGILDFSKIESGKLELESHTFGLVECIKDATDLFTPIAHQKGLTIVQQIQPNIPPAVQGDSGRLRQILVNLIGNATKFTEDGVITVTLECLDDGTDLPDQKWVQLYFTVSDTGIGIPQNKIGSLFDSFSQADISTTRKYGGTGLGLAITKHLVTMMNGRMWAESTVGQGSTFHFTVRLATAAASHRNDHARYHHQAEDDDDTLTPLSNLEALPMILIAEDNIVNQKVALRYLERLGYSADIVSNGVEAVEATARQTYDLILMDAQMPEMDGLTATREIRNRLPAKDQPLIVALSASVLESDRHNAEEAGMDGFLNKPLQLKELKNVLKSVTRSRAFTPATPS